MHRGYDPEMKGGAGRQPAATMPVHQRLVGFLLIFTITFPAGLRSAEPTWMYETHPDPFQRGSAIHLASIELPDASLTVRCSSSTRASEVRLYLNPELVEDMTGVTWKFDNRGSRSGKWQASANHRSILLPPGLQEDFVAQLRARGQLSVTILAEAEASTEFLFPLSGSSVALLKAMASCS